MLVLVLLLVVLSLYLAVLDDQSNEEQFIDVYNTYKRLDMNYVALHEGKRTNSEINASGVLKDASSKLFRGTIDFQHGSAESVGAEKEDVLLMGDDVVNQTIPLILCAEEDVKGSHGASIGQLDEETLFYMQARGISEEQAYALMADARIEAVLSVSLLQNPY